MKTCKQCRQEKAEHEFSTTGREYKGKVYRNNVCRACVCAKHERKNRPEVRAALIPYGVGKCELDRVFQQIVRSGQHG